MTIFCRKRKLRRLWPRRSLSFFMKVEFLRDLYINCLFVFILVSNIYTYFMPFFHEEKEISLDDDDDEPQYEEEKLQVNIYFLTHLRS